MTLTYGAATAAFQIEGAWDEDGRGESIWDRFCHTPGKVARGDTGDVACDHYHRWREDLDLLASLGIESYRFSIAWPRVQPDGRGALNPKGVAFYRQLVEGLLERGIEPVATLYHWDLPQALEDEGGWTARDTTERFAEYARLMAEQLGDVVAAWITHNEPWVVAFLGYAHGAKAPGVQDWPTALRVSHHLLLSHGLAARALRAATPAGTPVGITLNLHPQRPLGDAEDDLAAARIADGYANRWFLDPVFRGSYPEDMLELFGRRFGPPDSVQPGDLEVIAEPLDFLGVNYYFPQRVSADPDAVPLGIRHDAPRPPLTTMGWEQDPTGLHEMLVRIRRDYGDVPISITENGAAFDDRVEGGRVDDPRGSSTCAAIWTRSPARSPTASTSGATSCGRCWTTSSGSSAMRSGSASCTSTSTRCAARRSRARCGTAIRSPPRGPTLSLDRRLRVWRR